MWFCDFLIILIDGFINKTEKLKKKSNPLLICIILRQNITIPWQRQVLLFFVELFELCLFSGTKPKQQQQKITCLILNYIWHKTEMDMILYSDKQPHL